MSVSGSGSEDDDYIAGQRTRLLDKLKENDTHHAILIAYANQIWQGLKIATTPLEKAELELFKLIKNKADKLQLRKQAQVVEDLFWLPQDEIADDIEKKRQTPPLQQSYNDKNEHPSQSDSDNKGTSAKRTSLALEAGAQTAATLADQFNIDGILSVDITDGEGINLEAQQHKGVHSAHRKRSSHPSDSSPQNISHGSGCLTNIGNTVQNTSDQTTNKWKKRVERAPYDDPTNRTSSYRASCAESGEGSEDGLPEILVARQTPVATSTARIPSQYAAQTASHPPKNKPRKHAPANSRRKRSAQAPHFPESEADDDDYVDDEDQCTMPPPHRRARPRSLIPAGAYVAATNEIFRGRGVEANEFSDYRWEQIRLSVEENKRLTTMAIAVGRPGPAQAALAEAQKPRLESKDGVFFRTLYDAAKLRVAEENKAEQERLRNGRIGFLRYEDPETGEVHRYESLEDGPVDFEPPLKKFKRIREIWDEAWSPKPDKEPEGAVHFARPVDQPRSKLPAINSGVRLGAADVCQSALDGTSMRGCSILNASIHGGKVIGPRIGGSVVGSHNGSIRSLKPEQKFARSINKTSTVEEDAARRKDKGVKRDKWVRLGLLPGGVKPVFSGSASSQGVAAVAGGLTASNLRTHTVNAGGAVSNDPKTYAQRWQNDIAGIPESATSVGAGNPRSDVVENQTRWQEDNEPKFGSTYSVGAGGILMPGDSRRTERDLRAGGYWRGMESSRSHL